MSLLHEIHNQSHAVRLALWSLSMFVTLSIVGFFALSSLEQTMFSSLERRPEEQAAFAARRDARAPKPLAAISRGVGTLGATIGNALGFDRSAGFDRTQTKDKVYLLPLSD